MPICACFAAGAAGAGSGWGCGTDCLRLRLSVGPPAAERNDRPDGLDQAERPCSLEKSVDGSKSARPCEAEHVPLPALLQCIADQLAVTENRPKSVRRSTVRVSLCVGLMPCRTGQGALARTSSSRRATMVRGRHDGMRRAHSRATRRRNPRGNSSSGSGREEPPASRREVKKIDQRLLG